MAARRGRREEPAEIEPAVPPPRRSRIGPAIRMVRERLRRLRARRRGRHRVAWLAALLTLLVAGAAYALASDLIKSPQRAAVSGSGPWLGVDLTNAPMPGAMVAAVVPGSPAAAAGIRPRDVITALDTEPIVTPAIFVSAISGLQPGDAIQIQLKRGASEYTARVVLAKRPAGGP